MIVYSLNCAKHHTFEAWFRDSASYEAQASRRAVLCPECGSTKVSKAPMAPRLARGPRAEGEPAERPAEAQTTPAPAAKESPGGPALMAQKALKALMRQIEANCEYVGERFAEEARKIHYGEVKRRDIYGEAKDEEAEALTEEGVEFHRIPWLRRSDG
ncbi:MAG TPA: DUF1178 family protein [Alphaproteobacteria bacterium]|nr:DUF1178 family protein [Alphaproteobacteria bacterium]